MEQSYFNPAVIFPNNVYFWWLCFKQVVMKPDQSQDEGVQIAENLKKELGIKESDLLSGAYMDLILKQSQNGHDSW